MDSVKLANEARALLKKAQEKMQANQGDKFTQEAQQEINRMLDKADSLKAQSEQAQRLEKGLHHFETPEPGAQLPTPVPVDPQQKQIESNAQYTTAFNSYLRKGLGRLNPSEQKALQAGFQETKTLTGNTGIDGGFLAPADFRATLIEELAEMSGLRGRVNVTPASGSHLEIPRVEGASGDNAGIYANGIAISWVNAPSGVDDGVTEPEFGLLRIPMHDAVAKTRLGLNMVNDSAVSIEQALPRWYGEAMGLMTDYVILTGTGRGQPLGILNDPDVAVDVSAVSATIDGDDLIDLVYGLPAQYTANAGFITSRTNLKSVRKLQDSNGNYIWQPGLRDGEPDNLLGYPVIQSSFMPDIAAGAKAFIFGDLNYYRLGESQQMTIMVIREKYIEELKVGYMGHSRMGGQVSVARAMRILQAKA
jgi:HK97 family phage major capsid protein